MKVNYELKNTKQERDDKIMLWVFVIIPIGFGVCLGILSIILKLLELIF